MAFPTVAINSTGSNTAASGAGPATALSGTAAATAASTVVTLLVDNPDLSGVATDGSAVIWVGSSSGRQFSKITGVNNTAGVKTVTVSDAFANTESGKNWGIGGKRASLGGSTQLGLDMRGGWTIDVQTGETLTANFNVRPNAVPNTPAIFTSTAGSRPTLTTSTNSIYGLDISGAADLNISNIIFQSTAGTPGRGIAPAQNVGGMQAITVSNCVIDGFLYGTEDIDPGNNVSVAGMSLDSVEIKNCTKSGVRSDSGNSRCVLFNCYIHGNNTTGTASEGGVTANAKMFFLHCIIDNNKVYNVHCNLSTADNYALIHCDITNAGGGSGNNDGLIVNDGGGNGIIYLENCIVYGNGRYGCDINAGTPIGGHIIRNNAFGGNGTSDQHNSFPTGSGQVTLTASPFNSSSDFGLNATAGGGAACKGAAVAMLGSANTAPDIGAIPSGGGGSAGTSGGPPPSPIMCVPSRNFNG